MLGPTYAVGLQRGMNTGSQIDLNPRVACLDAVRSAVVEGDPVGKDVAGIQSLDQEQSLLNRRKPLRPLYFTDFGFQPRP